MEKDRQGYILEFDIEYSNDMHKKHNEVLVLAERMRIEKVEKLIPNLKGKKAYVLHIKNLNQALKYGLQLGKVYWVIRSEQRYCMKSCIMLNTKLRE